MKKPENLVHITDDAWSKALASFPRSVADETPNIIEWAAEAIQSYERDAVAEERLRISERNKYDLYVSATSALKAHAPELMLMTRISIAQVCVDAALANLYRSKP